MLKTEKNKLLFFSFYVVISSIQILAAYKNELFGDEAFYWLEGQWLSWSYSEVPGWTPWTLALADWIFPKHHFFIRIPGLLALMCIPWLGMALANRLHPQIQSHWITGLLLLALPLLGVAGILAVPDVWIIFFTLLAMLMLVIASQNLRPKNFIFLGLILAVGINVHLRFWLLVMISCCIFIWQFRNNSPPIIAIFKFTLPAMLLGFIPIILFNIQHDFPLLAFQLKDRHPWEFQASHFSFFLIQVIITTPVVFWLCIKAILATKQTANKVVAYTALTHWLVYAIVGFFSDNLRLNIHWTLVSYVLLLLLSAGIIQSRLKNTAWITGIALNGCLLITMLFWMHVQSPVSPLNARITNNAVGWQLLATKTANVLSNSSNKNLLVDHFMTLAQSKFYGSEKLSIKSLSHPLNRKHGRDKQLELMGLMGSREESNNSSQVLLIEHSALKLQQQINYYQMLCTQLNGIAWLDSLDIKYGLKTYHYFRTQVGYCQLPPIVYLNNKPGEVSGWILENKSFPVEITGIKPRLISSSTNIIESFRTELGSNQLFSTLDADQYQLIQFNIKGIDRHGPIQLELTWLNQKVYSQIMFP